jgi:hypothetical protein
MRHRPLPLALGLVLLASVAVGCTEEDKLPARNPAAAASSSTSGVGGGGDGGAGSGATGATGADGGAGGGTGGSATGGGGSESPCVGDRAFQAVGASFNFPTPEDLAFVLFQLSFDPSTHPFGVLLKGAPGPDAVVASSAIDASAFVGDAPAWGAAKLDGAHFSGQGELATGTMRLTTDGDPIDVPLTHITFLAQTFADCTGANVTFDAIIPASAADIELPTDDGPMTIGDLAGTPSGPMGGGEEGWTLRAQFPAEETSFDFGSAP